MFPKGSCAVTVKPKLLPAVGPAVAVAKISLLAGAAFTVRPTLADSRFAESDAVSVWGPALISFAEKLLWPFTSVELTGSTTPDEVSLLLKCTVPA